MSRRKELTRYILPSVLGCVSIFLFSIIDGVFVGRGVGTDAIGAVNIVFSFIMIFDALIRLTCTGGMTILAIRIGRGDTAGANQVFMHSCLAALIIGTLLTVTGTCFTDSICRALGADDSFLPLTRDYLFWYSIFLIPCGLCTCLMGFCRNDDAPALVSIATIISTVLNIFGDWLLIFPLKMGLKGAAIATGAAQSIGFLIVFVRFLLKKGKLAFSPFRIQRRLYKMIVLRGMPECVSCFSVPLCTILTNHLLAARIGPAGINTYSILGYVASFSVAIFVGVAEGIQPLLGQNYGRGDEEALHYFYNRGMLISVVGSIIISDIILAAGSGICILYAVDDATEKMFLYALPRFIWGFPVQAINVMIASYLYATTRTGYSLIINVLRSFVANVAVILLVPVLFGSSAIWYTFGIYEAVTAVFAIIFRRKADKNGICFREE